MEFLDLPKTIGGFLDSLGPGLTQVVVFLGVLVILIGVHPIGDVIRRGLERLGTLESLARNRFIKESGLLKLLPIGVLVAGVLFAVVLDRIVLGVGHILPGELGYTQPFALVTSVPAKTLGVLWSLYPAAPDEHTLYLVLENQASLATIPTTPGFQPPWRYHNERFAAGARAINSVKFYLFLGICFIVLARRLELSRRRVAGGFAVLLMIATGVTVFSVVQQIEAKRQSDWAKVNFVIASKVAAGKQFEKRLADRAGQEKYEEELHRYLDRRRQEGERAFYARW